MYTSYFGLKDNPFCITPDPSYLYLSSDHQEALAYLLYGAEENGGFVQLTGEVGTGKTLLIRTLLEQRLENVDIAFCLNPRLTVEEFVASICDELQVDYPHPSATLKLLIDALNAHLLKTHAQGRRTLLVIDEAQNLSREVLEQVRLLTNLETHRHKLLRIILVGQPELQKLLERQNMRQLAQRITARYHLTPLNRAETIAYVIHRLHVAGGREDLFTRSALRAVYKQTGGVPRLINTVCDRALLGAYGRELKRVNGVILRHAAREALHGPELKRVTGRGFRFASGIILTAAIGVVAGLLLPHVESNMTPLLSPVLPRVNSSILVNGSVEKTVPPDSSGPSPALETQQVELPRIETWFAGSQSSNDAMERLLKAWGEEPMIPPDTPPCEYVQKLNLHCLEGTADWDQLRRYNRPVILDLVNSKGKTRQVLLRSLEGDTAVLELGEHSVRTDLTQLDSLWSGGYLMLWRSDTSMELIGHGTVSESVIWLRRRLALIEGHDPSRESLPPLFDSALEARVRDFQRTHDLRPDGLVGERTMALLSILATVPGTPFLIPSSDEVQ